MVVDCKPAKEIKINYTSLLHYLDNRRSIIDDNYEFDIEGLNEWYAELENGPSIALVSLESLGSSLERKIKSDDDKNGLRLIFASPILFADNYCSNLTRLDGSRGGPVFLLDNAFAISDCLAAGRFNNAAILREQAIQLLGQRAYRKQELYAKDLALAKDPANYVEIIPQRLFAFVHELMGKRAGEAAQPWKDWDIVPDPDYVTAARAVYTEDMEEAAETVCRLCNLHIEHSNPFAFDSDNDRLLGFEFDDPVRAIWPTEIFAWLRLRQERGLALPEVSHPLLDQPLGRFEPKLPRKIEHEDWFIELVHKLAAFHPRYAELPRMVFDDP